VTTAAPRRPGWPPDVGPVLGFSPMGTAWPPVTSVDHRPARPRRGRAVALVLLASAVAACGPPEHSTTGAGVTTKATTTSRTRAAPIPASTITTTTTRPPVPRATTTTIAPPAPTPEGRCPTWHLLAQPHVASADITEASGLAGGQLNPGVWWTHNDSGDVARLFALEGDGRLLTTVTVAGAEAWDWEDIDMGPGPGGRPYLYVADVGDNFRIRQSSIRYQLYRLPEPRLGTIAPAALTTRADRIDIVFPDGPHNTEATLLDPVTGDYVIITKETPATVFRIPAAKLVAGSTVVPTKVGDMTFDDPANGHDRPVGADISADGSMVVVKTMELTWFWPRTASRSVPDTLLHDAPCPGAALGPGEAVAFNASGGQLASLAEGPQQPLYRYERG
jgi:hypothetical protein